MQIGIHPLIQAPVALGMGTPTTSETPGKTAGEAAGDRVELSPAAQALSGPLAAAAGDAASAHMGADPQNRHPAQPQSTDEPAAADPAAAEASSNKLSEEELSEDEQAQVKELKARDREVKAHEQAHLAAAGPYARGGPSYDYQRGPDGKRYAVGGEVSIDTAPVADDPEATIRKAQVVKRAAMAPAEPSDQDRRVAAEAGQMEASARRELAEIRREEATGTADGAGAVQEAPAIASADAPQPSAEGGEATAGQATPPPRPLPTPYGRSSDSTGSLLDISA